MTSEAIRILLVEDNDVDAALVVGLLSQAGAGSFQVQRVTNLADAFHNANAHRADVVILDLGLSDSMGLDTLRRLLEQEVHTPVLVLTASDEESLGLQSIQEGAQDYLLKSQLQRPLLVRAVRYAVERDRAAKLADKKIRSSEAQLWRFIKEAPVAAAMFDREMRYLAVSHRWNELYGRGHADLLGLNHYEVNSDLPEEWKEVHRLGLAGEFLSRERDRWVLADHSERWVRWSLQPWRDTAGNIGGIIISAEDITESVKTEESLRFTESLMRETGHIAKVGGWEFEVATGKGFWTEEVARIHELDPGSQPTVASGLSFYTPESRGKIEAALQAAVAQGASYDLELELITAKGNRRWIRTISHPILENGVATRVQGSFQDITDRKLTDDILRRQASLIEQAYDAVIVWERNGAITFWNRAAERIYGHSKEQAVGKVSHELLKTKTAGGIEGVLRTLDEKGIWEGELNHTCSDGRRIVVESRMVQIGEGDRLYILETNRDVSERRLLEDQLRQSQKMEAIGRLAGGIAHDFNNLLGVILGSAELVAESKDRSTMLSRVKEIEKAGQRAASLTRQLLAFSRRQVLEPRVIDLNAQVTEMAEWVKRLAGDDIVFTFRGAPNLAAVRLDPHQVEHIVLNLVVNARDAMPRGGNIVIETQNVVLDETYAHSHPAVRPGTYVMMAFSDSGAGMDGETQTRIFEPFFTTKPNGTGLGLSTVYGVVKQSGGHIWVYSEIGKGTTFKIYFPTTDQPPEMPEAPPIRQDVLPGSETVLLVEDSDSLREVTREFLQIAGYSTIEFADAEQALRFARGNGGPIHLLLTDVVMPGMNGRDLARELQNIHPETRVLFMSGYTANAIHHHGVLEEGLSLLTKPFTRAGLTQKVRELLDS